MKILVISDSHGQNNDIFKVVGQVGDIDMLIHCGDIGGGAEYLETIVSCTVYAVSGNNDFFAGLPREIVVDVGGYLIFVAHGHYHGVNRGTGRLEEAALARGANIALFGHTHRPYLNIGEEVTVANPGSISYPRQEDRKPTFLVIDIDEKGIAHYTHGFLRR